jgi:hypothetical protein
MRGWEGGWVYIYNVLGVGTCMRACVTCRHEYTHTHKHTHTHTHTHTHSARALSLSTSLLSTSLLSCLVNSPPSPAPALALSRRCRPLTHPGLRAASIIRIVRIQRVYTLRIYLFSAYTLRVYLFFQVRAFDASGAETRESVFTRNLHYALYIEEEAQLLHLLGIEAEDVLMIRHYMHTPPGINANIYIYIKQLHSCFMLQIY